MTDQRDLDRLLVVFLREGTNEIADRVIDAALDQVDHTTQRHALSGPRRFLMTQLQLRLATAAVIGVLVVGGSLYLLQRGQTNVGNPSSSPALGTSPSALQSSPTPAPQTSPAAEMTVGRGVQTATLLADGRVLIAGGYTTGGASLASAEIYDPATRTFTATGSMATARAEHTATLLADGRVLIAGGVDNFAKSLASAELYDPATGTFTSTGPMTDARAFHTATLLADGRVLVTGGMGTSARLASAEIYDPKRGTFGPTASMAFGADLETATLLADGRVLVAGGAYDYVSGLCFTSAEIFDPKSGTFSPTGSMGDPRCGHTATLLPDGRVLMTTGTQSLSGGFQSSAEIFDPKTGTFSPTGSMAHAPGKQTAVLLAGGRVLIAGGNQVGTHSLSSAELYDPSTGTYSPTGAMAVSRTLHTATLLSDGRVLVTGGTSNGWNFDGPFLGSAEIYDPVTGTFGPAD